MLDYYYNVIGKLLKDMVSWGIIFTIETILKEIYLFSLWVVSLGVFNYLIPVKIFTLWSEVITEIWNMTQLWFILWHMQLISLIWHMQLRSENDTAKFFSVFVNFSYLDQKTRYDQNTILKMNYNLCWPVMFLFGC